MCKGPRFWLLRTIARLLGFRPCNAWRYHSWVEAWRTFSAIHPKGQQATVWDFDEWLFSTRREWK